LSIRREYSTIERGHREAITFLVGKGSLGVTSTYRPRFLLTRIVADCYEIFNSKASEMTKEHYQFSTSLYDSRNIVPVFSQ
jgi:hypothetical protein